MSSDVSNPHNNGAVLNIAQLIKAVMSLAAEAELEVEPEVIFSCHPTSQTHTTTALSSTLPSSSKQ